MTNTVLHDTQNDAYRQAGVDISEGNALVAAIKPLAASTARKGANASLGGFAAALDLKAAGYKDPIVLTTTDGVGTKLKLAIETNHHGTVGMDLVAMCVNDLIVTGAEPLVFLDYYATGRLSVAAARAVIEGIAEGCRQAGCALAGGETAEMPGMYRDGDYDLAGFALGAVERDAMLDGSLVAAGDVVLGVASSGVHSNGFSLVRKIIEDNGLKLSAAADFAPGLGLGEAFLTPTAIYVKSALAAARMEAVHAMAHITGGGLLENIPRVLPAGLGVALDASSWELPAVFRWLKRKGRLDDRSLARTFNCGIGLVVIVPVNAVAKATACFTEHGYVVNPIGTVVSMIDPDNRVIISNQAQAWKI